MSEIHSESHRKDHATTNEKQQQSTSIYSNSTTVATAPSYLYNQTEENNNRGTIHDLNLADGLIDLLIENNFTIQSLVKTNAFELSQILGIDVEVAAIICKEANKEA
jgi:hypothetical protein